MDSGAAERLEKWARRFSGAEPALKRKKHRFSFELCQELGHFILQEMEKNARLGLPEKSMKAILEDWALLGARHRGYKIPGDRKK